MTLQASGPIDISDINEKTGRAANFSSSLSFLNNQIVSSQRPAQPRLSNFYNLNYFQNTTQGNCNNGNCTSNCNCGNIQCNNCLISGTVNCANCDAQAWLQTNCNCACTYNCTTSQTSYNCNCDCSGCVVATELTSRGEWEKDRLASLIRWAERVLDRTWIGEKLHRGYHVIGPKVIIPGVRRNDMVARYLKWNFAQATNMLQGRKYDPISVPLSLLWMGAMVITGLLVSQRYARRIWAQAYKEIKNGS